uniref:Uncharacterized protein n=1 Tax=Oryza punctata TaxID=4537 RepID=A0A0E0KRE4_ORYPU
MFVCFGRPYSGPVFVVPLSSAVYARCGAARRVGRTTYECNANACAFASGRERRSGSSGGGRGARLALADGLFTDSFGRSTEVWEVEKCFDSSNEQGCGLWDTAAHPDPETVSPLMC